MNNEHGTPILNIAGMVIFGLLGIAAFITGCAGHTHQFFIAAICAVMFYAIFSEYKQEKSK